MAKNNRSLSLRRKEEELADMEQKTQQIREWIEGLLKEKLPKQPFREVLLDGVVLCKLANAIKRDCIKRYHKKTSNVNDEDGEHCFLLDRREITLQHPPSRYFCAH